MSSFRGQYTLEDPNSVYVQAAAVLAGKKSGLIVIEPGRFRPSPKERVSPGEIVTRDDLSMLLEQLHNPASELYLKAFELLML